MVLNKSFFGHPLCKPGIMKSHFLLLDFTYHLLIHLTSFLFLFLCLLFFSFSSLSSLKLNRSLLHRDALLESLNSMVRTITLLFRPLIHAATRSLKTQRISQTLTTQDLFQYSIFISRYLYLFPRIRPENVMFTE